jgi:hypothetical protein
MAPILQLCIRCGRPSNDPSSCCVPLNVNPFASACPDEAPALPALLPGTSTTITAHARSQPCPLPPLPAFPPSLPLLSVLHSSLFPPGMGKFLFPPPPLCPPLVSLPPRNGQVSLLPSPQDCAILGDGEGDNGRAVGAGQYAEDQPARGEWGRRVVDQHYLDIIDAWQLLYLGLSHVNGEEPK